MLAFSRFQFRKAFVDCVTQRKIVTPSPGPPDPLRTNMAARMGNLGRLPPVVIQAPLAQANQN